MFNDREREQFAELRGFERGVIAIKEMMAGPSKNKGGRPVGSTTRHRKKNQSAVTSITRGKKAA